MGVWKCVSEEKGSALAGFIVSGRDYDVGISNTCIPAASHPPVHL